MDRNGPGRALRIGVGLFAGGLLVAGLAPTMTVFLLGRALQGFGDGVVTVGLYVVVGRVFAPSQRARVFTVMTSAWVLPALVGPLVAGGVAELVGWRWVFLAVPVLAGGALLLVGEAMSGPGADAGGRVDGRRVGWAVVAAAAVLLVSLAGQRGLPAWPVLLTAAVVVGVRSAARLVPPGTLTGRRGLPAVIAARSLLSAGYFGAEAYVPLSLVNHRGLSPAQAGVLLTAAAVLWFAGSWLAANVPALSSRTLRVRIGAGCVLVGTLAGFGTLDGTVPVPAVALVWGIGGLGMGMAASTLSVLLLEQAAPGEHGSASAAMQTGSAIVAALVLAIGSVVFAVVLGVDDAAAYVLVFALASLVAGLGAVTTTRLLPRSRPVGG